MYNRYSANPVPTPKLIKYLMIVTLSFGALSGFFNSLLGMRLKISFLNLFAFSFKGLKSGFIWQPLTYIFVPEIEGSLTFYFLFTLCFDIYLLWFIGCKVHSYLGQKETAKLFFIPSFFACLFALILGHSFQKTTPLFGISFSMVPLVVAYCFSNPHATFAFIPTYSLKVKWLGLGLVALYLFQDISNLNGIAFLAHILVFSFTYLYMVIIQKKQSPFAFTHKIDDFFISRRRRKESSKIVHLYETYESHESFINKTLDKIGQNQKISIWDRLRLRIYRFRKRSRL